jgi:RimJ/RimL family protein N-acetyltransferase
MLHKLMPQDYGLVKPLFDELTINLIITAVFESSSPGCIYVDNTTAPTSAFMDSAEGHFLVGDADNPAFNAALKELIVNTFFAEEPYIVLECATPDWVATFDIIFQGRVVHYPRLYYTFDHMKLDWRAALPDGFTMQQVNAAFLEQTHLRNMDVVLDAIRSNWNSQAEFFQDGFGFCLINDEAVVSWCMADCASNERCEIGIHTDYAYQKRGLASLTVSATVEHALGRGFTTIGWHCWQHNLASIKVAEKVGFQLQRHYDAYMCLANDSAFSLERGAKAARAGEHQEAIGWFNQAGTNAWAYFLAARSHAVMGANGAAIGALRHAADQGWDHPNYLLTDEFKTVRTLPDWKMLPDHWQFKPE